MQCVPSFCVFWCFWARPGRDLREGEHFFLSLLLLCQFFLTCFTPKYSPKWLKYVFPRPFLGNSLFLSRQNLCQQLTSPVVFKQCRPLISSHCLLSGGELDEGDLLEVFARPPLLPVGFFFPSWVVFIFSQLGGGVWPVASLSMPWVWISRFVGFLPRGLVAGS